MLQSQNLMKLLVELLEPVPEVSSANPVAISLVSRQTDHPLLTCISKQYQVKETSSGSSNGDADDTNGGGIIVSSTPESGTLLVDEVDADDSAARIRQLQTQIDEMEEKADTNYINASQSPSDNMSIVSILAMKQYTARAETGETTPWMMQKCNEYLLFLYEVNQDYMVIMCCEDGYRAGFAIKRLEKLCRYLRDNIS